jgi:hypothetical protein
MLGAYRETPAFAYPGWRLTVPGGPAGGHYKGFTHSEGTGTDLEPQDSYEQDREDGMSSHDAVHASPRNPKGVYRSSGEVPPRPNASGSAHTYRSLQTERHPGTSVAPGSFPAEFIETLEDAFLTGAAGLGDLGWQIYGDAGPEPMPLPIIGRPNIATYPVMGPITSAPDLPIMPYPITHGPINVVNQPPASPAPLPPSPSVPVYVAPPVSPAPAPTVPTNEVVPLNDGSGSYVNVSTGQIVPASAVAQNPATGQLFQHAFSWLEQPSSLWASLPNWGLLAIGVGALALFGGGSKRR